MNLKIFGLYERCNDKVHGFSKGMKRRLKKTIQSVQSIEFSFNHNSADQLEELRRLPRVNDAQKVGVIIYSTPIVNAPVLVIGMILTAFCFATLGTLFAAYTGKSLFSPGLDIAVLVIFILIFQIAANYLYKKFNE